MKIKFKIYPIGKGWEMIIVIKVNGKNCRMAIDSGATRTVFDKRRISAFVDKKMVKKTGTISQGAGGKSINHSAILNIKIGTLLIEKYEAYSIDLKNINEGLKQHKLSPIDGLLGCDILYENKFVIDFNKEELRLKK